MATALRMFLSGEECTSQVEPSYSSNPALLAIYRVPSSPWAMDQFWLEAPYWVLLKLLTSGACPSMPQSICGKTIQSSIPIIHNACFIITIN